MIIPDHHIISSDCDTRFVGISSVFLGAVGSYWLLHAKIVAGWEDVGRVLMVVFTTVILPNMCVFVKDYYTAHLKPRVIKKRLKKVKK